MKCLDIASTCIPSKQKQYTQFDQKTYPMKSKTVKHCACSLHYAENSDSEAKPKGKCDDHHDCTEDARNPEGLCKGHIPKHNRKLLVSEGECPQTKIRSSMRYAVEAEFYFTR